jgi:putative transposase
MFSMDVMSDVLKDVSKVLLFNMIGDFNHKARAINIELSYTVRAAVETLECLKQEIGKP